MNIFYPTKKWKGLGPGVKWQEVPRLHIGWNEEDVEMWKTWPFEDEEGNLAYNGGAVMVIQERPRDIRIFIVKSHTGKGNSRIGKVKVKDGTHTAEIIVDNPVKSYSPRPGLLERIRKRH